MLDNVFTLILLCKLDIQSPVAINEQQTFSFKKRFKKGMQTVFTEHSKYKVLSLMWMFYVEFINPSRRIVFLESSLHLKDISFI